jgi:hypothetical protein
MLVLNISAALNDSDKVAAEFFESKNMAFGFPLAYLGTAGVVPGLISGQLNWTVDDWANWEFAINGAIWDAVILAWSVKRQRDAVRPMTAIRFLYRTKNVTAWGGPGKGTTTQLGAGFQSYLRTMAHSEYPSASSCMCSAFAEASRRAFGSDNFYNFSFLWLNGTSGIEPGVVPAQNTFVGPFQNYTAFAQACGRSRIVGGVHFPQAIKDALVHCEVLGRLAINKWRTYIEGTATEVMDPLDRDTWPENDSDDVDLASALINTEPLSNSNWADANWGHKLEDWNS